METKEEADAAWMCFRIILREFDRISGAEGSREARRGSANNRVGIVVSAECTAVISFEINLHDMNLATLERIVFLWSTKKSSLCRCHGGRL